VPGDEKGRNLVGSDTSAIELPAEGGAREQADRFPEFHAHREYRMYIDGDWRLAASGKSFSCVDPYTETRWGRVPLAGAEDVGRAVIAARRAFDDGPWRNTTPAQRATLLRRLGDLVEAHAERLGRCETHENGRLLTEMVGAAHATAGDCHYFAGLAETVHGLTVPSSVPEHVGYTLREPIGVVAAITPWNGPLTLLGLKLLPALAAGNTVVVKPSEVTPVSTLLLAELVDEAGFPPGVVNVVTGPGAVGAALAEHRMVDKISFTGSSATGKRIAAVAAERNARVSLELGGKSPNIVFGDADIDDAVTGVMNGVFGATGQICIAGSRVLVERSVYDGVAELLVERTRKIKLGDPLERGTQMGPVASHAQLGRVLAYVDVARGDGLEILVEREAVPGVGFFVNPTIVAAPTNSSRVAREEIFGPVACLIPFDGEDEAVRIANDTVYGLAAGVWTESLSRAHRMIGRLRVGNVWVNTYRVIPRSLPFGGYKESGLGRELGPAALDEFTESKSVWINMRKPTNPFAG
jgi:acyl-CoA reductase-like NAD-dependent aldehyde dehydrogenase